MNQVLAEKTMQKRACAYKSHYPRPLNPHAEMIEMNSTWLLLERDSHKVLLSPEDAKLCGFPSPFSHGKLHGLQSGICLSGGYAMPDGRSWLSKHRKGCLSHR
jgi:hypothetical protein